MSVTLLSGYDVCTPRAAQKHRQKESGDSEELFHRRAEEHDEREDTKAHAERIAQKAGDPCNDQAEGVARPRSERTPGNDETSGEGPTHDDRGRAHERDHDPQGHRGTTVSGTGEKRNTAPNRNAPSHMKEEERREKG